MSTNDQPNLTRAQERDRLIDQFKDRYGSFESEKYLQDERNYKVRLAEHVRDSLDKQQLERLIASNSYEEAARLIRRTYQRQENNLLNSWDRLPLEDAPDDELTRGLYALLYGTEAFAERFNSWVALLSRKAPNCWPMCFGMPVFIPTSFLAACPCCRVGLNSALLSETKTCRSTGFWERSMWFARY